MDFASSYVKTINKIKYFIVFFWLICSIISCYFGPQFLSSTVNNYEPPPGSPASIGNDQIRKDFPSLGLDATFIIFINSLNDTINCTDCWHVKNFTEATFLDASKYGDKNMIEQYEGYYTIIDKGLPSLLAEDFLSKNFTSTFISVVVNIDYQDKDAERFASHLRTVINKNQELYLQGSYEATLLGIPAFISILQESVEADLGLMDAIVLPIALIILAWILKSLRLMILPICAIITSGTTSFGIMFVVSQFVDIVSFTPSLMMSCLIALSIDYSLFLLTRYREEIYYFTEPYQAVVEMISSAGHTITVSGFTLAVCFCGLNFFPLAILYSIGIGASVCIVMILLVNLTQTTALLLIFPNFFKRCVDPLTCCEKTCYYGSRKPSSITYIDAYNSDQDSLFIDNREITNTYMFKSFWYKFGKIITRFPFNILFILLIIGSTVPIDIYAYNYNTTNEMSSFLPRGTKESVQYSIMAESFGQGKVVPIKLIIEPHNSTVMNDIFFKSVQSMLLELINITELNPDEINSVVYAKGKDIDYGYIQICDNEDLPFYNMSECKGLRYAQELFVSENDTATLILITPDYDTNSVLGIAMLKEMRKFLKEKEKLMNCSFYMSSISTDSMDSIDAVYNYFPIMISITCGVVLIFVSIAFRSILIPLRSIFTITLTIVWVFGLARLTYELGILNWTHIPGFKNELGALLWIVPIVDFSVIVGIGLDYDIFLLVRVLEYRNKGWKTNDAIIQGLYKTGHIITAAGIIMAIAFSGLLLSRTPAINQLGFYLVFAVLFDTFIVRSILVPAIMSLFKELNWCPSKPSDISYHDLSTIEHDITNRLN